MIARIAAALVLAIAPVAARAELAAHAEASPPRVAVAVSANPGIPAPPDQAAVEAGDANLESTANRQGFTFAGSIGGGLTVGFGIDDSVGRGGSVSLRLGHVATPSTVITFELGFTAVLHRPTTNAAIATNTNTTLLAGGLHYVNPSLWVRGGAGLGIYQGRDINLAGDDVSLVGPAVLFGVGLDLARFKSAVIDLEVATSATINRDGLLIASGAGLGLSFD